MGRMPLQYDLHSHSIASDGTLSPVELVAAAHAAGVDVLALTDHDTLDGLVEAGDTAQALGLQLVPGVEISVSWQSQTIHVLGLNVDPACTALLAGLEGLREFRHWRAREIGRRLARAGIGGCYDGACAFAKGNIVGRTHFAQHLVAAGHARSVREVFKRFLVNHFIKHFKLKGTPVFMDFRDSENPYKDRKNTLSRRQLEKRKRLKKFTSRK